MKELFFKGELADGYLLPGANLFSGPALHPVFLTTCIGNCFEGIIPDVFQVTVTIPAFRVKQC